MDNLINVILMYRFLFKTILANLHDKYYYVTGLISTSHRNPELDDISPSHFIVQLLLSIYIN